MRLSTRLNGTPSSTSACPASIRLPSMMSATTAPAPARGVRFLDALRVDVERDKADALLVEQARQILAAAPVTAYHDVLTHSHRLHRDVVHFHRARQPV